MVELFQMRYRIEFTYGNLSMPRYFEHRDRSVLHSRRTFFARDGGNESPIDTVVPNEQNRVIRMNGQKAFYETRRPSMN